MIYNILYKLTLQSTRSDVIGLVGYKFGHSNQPTAQSKL